MTFVMFNAYEQYIQIFKNVEQPLTAIPVFFCIVSKIIPHSQEMLAEGAHTYN